MPLNYKEGKLLQKAEVINMNCLCNLFDDNCTWIIILALVLVFSCGCCGSR